MPPSSSAFASGTAAAASSSAMTGTTCRTDRQARTQQAQSRGTCQTFKHDSARTQTFKNDTARRRCRARLHARNLLQNSLRRRREGRVPGVLGGRGWLRQRAAGSLCTAHVLRERLAGARGGGGWGGAWGLLSCAPPGASACIAACARGGRGALPARPCGALLRGARAAALLLSHELHFHEQLDLERDVHRQAAHA